MGQMLRTDSSNTDFITLVALLDIDLAARDGEENTFYAQFNGISVLEHCVVYYENNIPLGCGALKAFDDTNMESKRIYVSVSSQGKGIASLLLTKLEKWTAELGYTSCVLKAVALYKKNNYVRIPNYTHYTEILNSVCFRKVV
jgi:putative acetyltransferase